MSVNHGLPKTKLVKPKASVAELLREQKEASLRILESARSIGTSSELNSLKLEFERWIDRTSTILRVSFSSDEVEKEFNFGQISGGLYNPTLQFEIRQLTTGLETKISDLSSIMDKLDLYDEEETKLDSNPTPRPDPKDKGEARSWLAYLSAFPGHVRVGIQAIPALKYALGVVVIVALVSAATSYASGNLFAAGIMFGGGLLATITIVVFVVLVDVIRDETLAFYIKYLAIIFTYFAVGMFMLLTTSVAFGIPDSIIRQWVVEQQRLWNLGKTNGSGASTSPTPTLSPTNGSSTASITPPPPASTRQDVVAALTEFEQEYLMKPSALNITYPRDNTTTLTARGEVEKFKLVDEPPKPVKVEAEIKWTYERLVGNENQEPGRTGERAKFVLEARPNPIGKPIVKVIEKIWIDAKDQNDDLTDNNFSHDSPSTAEKSFIDLLRRNFVIESR